MFDHLERDMYGMQEYTAALRLQHAAHAIVSRERPKHHYPHTWTLLRLFLLGISRGISPGKKEEIFVKKMRI